jgi:hypothetical protein
VAIRITGGTAATVNGILWYAAPITVSQPVTTEVTVLNAFAGDLAFRPDGLHVAADSEGIDNGINTHSSKHIDGEKRPAGSAHGLGADTF